VKAKLSILTSVPEPVVTPAETILAVPELPPGSEAEDAGAPLSVITDTMAISAKTLHLKSTDWLALVLFIIHLSF
jgi:hypothetical protein